ncbi:MFS transporter [Natronosporangium hydrolyticum]|uniref:MFS transporter n=1 Tax=Natronosporangium hydrolyticum TaxID=2811111 RepID=UPI001EFA1DC8|nr:MFS transporter [Natronosporangium hydrolyticum]
MRTPSLGLLADPDYRRLFASTSVSQFGFQITQLALPLVAIMALAASPFQVGLLTALSTASFLLLGLPAGAWVDRWRRRTVLIVGDLGRAVVLITVPVAWWAGVLTMSQLYVVAFLLGTFTVFFDVAYQSYLPHLVGRPNLVEGNSKLESVRALAQLGGPALAGQLIRWLTAPVALLLDAVAMAASAIFVARIRKPEPKPAPRPDAHLLREIGEGLRFVLGHRLLRPIAATTGTANLFGAAAMAVTLLFLERELGLNAGTIGLVITVASGGGLLGAIYARRLAGRFGQGPTIWAAIAFTAPFQLLMPLVAAPGWRLWVAAAGGFVASFGVVVYNVTQVSFRQSITPDALLGRMNATIRFLVWGTLPIGGLLGGVLGELLGIRGALLAATVASCFAFLPAFCSPLRGMRRLPEPDDPVTVDAVS